MTSVVELFRGLQSTPRTSIQGLWGELLLIAESSNPDLAAGAWHALTSDRFDFAHEGERLEVKTSMRQRRHHFSLEQLQQPEGAKAYVASIVVESSAAGSTIPELLHKIGVRCTEKGKVVRVATDAVKTLGSETRNWSSSRFDVQSALRSTRILPAADVPSVVPSSGVQDVRFVVNLEEANLPSSNPAGSGALVRALSPW